MSVRKTCADFENCERLELFMLAKVLKPLENGRGNRTGHFFRKFFEISSQERFHDSCIVLAKIQILESKKFF